MHPSNKLPVLCFNRAMKVKKHRQLDVWSYGHSLFSCITTVIKSIFTIKEIDCGTHELLFKSRFKVVPQGKSLYLLELNKNKRTFVIQGAFALSAQSELMKCSNTQYMINCCYLRLKALFIFSRIIYFLYFSARTKKKHFSLFLKQLIIFPF